MGIETKYDYKYYTVINTEEWRRGNEDIWERDDEGFTWQKAIDFINYKFKNSEDQSVNNYRVDYAGYEQDIKDWIRIHERNKERPVFVQFQDNQPIKTMGEGTMFVLYEEDYEEDEEDCFHIYPTSPEHLDGLAGAGGRL
tara:strand:- start:263 stop:682 length:420 start_codon:yes stop_codon:yes gene_type:complete